MQIYDLSQTLVHEMYVWPDDPPVLFEPFLTYEQHGANATFLKIGAHSGTNADAPLGYSVDGLDIVDFPLSTWVGYAIVLKISKEQHEVISREEIENLLGNRDKEEILLIATGWEKRWGTPEYFTDYPRFAPEVADLIAEKGFKMVGFDLPNPDPGEGNHPFHKICFSHDIGILESLCNLSQVVGKRIILFAAPLKMKGVEASPVRALGIEL